MCTTRSYCNRSHHGPPTPGSFLTCSFLHAWMVAWRCTTSNSARVIADSRPRPPKRATVQTSKSSENFEAPSSKVPMSHLLWRAWRIRTNRTRCFGIAMRGLKSRSIRRPVRSRYPSAELGATDYNGGLMIGSAASCRANYALLDRSSLACRQ